jgi:hypothetical protein
MVNNYKIVVFDLDETLGYFVELGVFWLGLEEYFRFIRHDYKLSQQIFNQILDLYPEFQRPNIMYILNYLKLKKTTNACNKIMIYTNNQGPKYWSEYIQKYYESKMNYKLFDQIISAFKINGEKIEIGRTSHRKSHADLINCTKIPPNAEICFLDDTYYQDMVHDNVYYINVKPYIHDIRAEVLLDRLIKSELLQKQIKNTNVFQTYIMAFIQQYDYECKIKDEKELQIDKAISKKIMEHLRVFFKNNTNMNNTLKHKYPGHNKTYKNKNKKNDL